MNAKFRYNDFTIWAKKIRYYLARQLVLADQSVLIENRGIITRRDKATVKIKNGSVEIK